MATRTRSASWIYDFSKKLYDKKKGFDQAWSFGPEQEMLKV